MLRNGEHYTDPTMSSAVKSVDKPTYSKKPVFVQDETIPPPPVFISRQKALPISEMDLEDLKPLLKGCHKCGGDPEVCVRCNGGCAFGTRAVELLNEMERERKHMMTGREKGNQVVRAKAMMDYQDAIKSGDMVQWVIDHMKHRTDQENETIIRGMAKQKIRDWRRKYGGLIKETPEAAASMDVKRKSGPAHKKEPVHNIVEESEPHLMQMPCLSKKVAAERASAQKVELEIGTMVPPLPSERKHEPASSVVDLFVSKLTDLRNQVAELQEQIMAIENAAQVLGVAI